MFSFFLYIRVNCKTNEQMNPNNFFLSILNVFFLNGPVNLNLFKQLLFAIFKLKTNIQKKPSTTTKNYFHYFSFAFNVTENILPYVLFCACIRFSVTAFWVRDVHGRVEMMFIQAKLSISACELCALERSKVDKEKKIENSTTTTTSCSCIALKAMCVCD